MYGVHKDKQEKKPSLKQFMSVGEKGVFKVVITYKGYRECILKQNGANKWLNKYITGEKWQILLTEEFQVINVDYHPATLDQGGEA